MSVTVAPVLAASCEIARLWSRRVSAEKRSERDVGGVLERDQRVGVGRVAGHADADVVSGDLVERLALGGEDRAVGRQQVAALHARAARAGADEQGEVHAVEDLLRVGADLDAGEVRERAVVQLHDDALERLQRRLDLEQAKLDGTVAGDGSAGDAEEQAVADLAGGAGDGDLQRRVAHGYSLGMSAARPTTTPRLGDSDASSGRVGRRTRPDDVSRGARRCPHAPLRAARRRRRDDVARADRVRQRVGAEPADGDRRAGDPDAVARSGRLRRRRRQHLAAAAAGEQVGVPRDVLRRAHPDHGHRPRRHP